MPLGPGAPFLTTCADQLSSGFVVVSFRLRVVVVGGTYRVIQVTQRLAFNVLFLRTVGAARPRHRTIRRMGAREECGLKTALS